MSVILKSAALLLTTTAMASAGGLDRSFQSTAPVFNDDNTLAVGAVHVRPTVTGSDLGAGTGNYDAANNYTRYQLDYTNSINDNLSYTFVYDQPFGADVFYGGDPTTSNLAGTRTDISTQALSYYMRYKLNDRFSVFGGIRAQEAGGRVSLSGLGYASAISVAGAAATAGVDAATLGAALQGSPGAIAALPAPVQAALPAIGAGVAASSTAFATGGGYDVNIDQSWGVGFSLGAAYEIPDIALRLAVTYHSEINHSGTSVETSPLPTLGVVGTTTFDTPQSINVEFQSGIAQDTLLTAGVRWTDWGAFDVTPPSLNTNLSTLTDTFRWSLGVGRKFTDHFAGNINLTYEEDQGRTTVSPLAPEDGKLGLTIGGRYEKDNLSVLAGLNYTRLGNATISAGAAPVAQFDDNDLVAVGLQVKFAF